MTRFLQKLYDLLLRARRLRRLADILSPHMPQQGAMLDIGCGNGHLAGALHKLRPALVISGIEVMPQENAPIPIISYDGATIPYPDRHFDCVLLITVLHHTDDYAPLLKEAKRVARDAIILLDHQYANWLDWMLLALIDWPGNVPFGVYTPLNFNTRAQWIQLFQKLDLKEIKHEDRLYLFGKYVDCIFGRNMHFVSVLQPHP